MSPRELIRRYYDDLWNRWQVTLIPDLLRPDVTFRGSLGETVRGHDGFRGYVDRVRRAFPDFHNEIADLLLTDRRVAVRLRYTGTHRGRLFGQAPTGRRVAYTGIALYRLKGGRIAEGWVFGDTLTLYRQLTERRT